MKVCDLPSLLEKRVLLASMVSTENFPHLCRFWERQDQKEQKEFITKQQLIEDLHVSEQDAISFLEDDNYRKEEILQQEGWSSLSSFLLLALPPSSSTSSAAASSSLSEEKAIRAATSSFFVNTKATSSVLVPFLDTSASSSSPSTCSLKLGEVLITLIAKMQHKSETTFCLMCNILNHFCHADCERTTKYNWALLVDYFVKNASVVSTDLGATCWPASLLSCVFAVKDKVPFGRQDLADAYAKVAAFVTSTQSAGWACGVVNTIVYEAKNHAAFGSPPVAVALLRIANEVIAKGGVEQVIEDADHPRPAKWWAKALSRLSLDDQAVQNFKNVATSAGGGSSLSTTLSNVKSRIDPSDTNVLQWLKQIEIIFGSSSSSSNSVSSSDPSSPRTKFVDTLALKLDLSKETVEFFTSNRVGESDFVELESEDLASLPLGDRKRILKEIHRLKEDESSGVSSPSSSSSSSSSSSAPVSESLRLAQQRLVDLFGEKYSRLIYNESELEIDFASSLGGGAYGGVHPCRYPQGLVAAKVFRNFSDGEKEAALMLELCTDHELHEHVVEVRGVAAVQRKSKFLFENQSSSSSSSSTFVPPPDFVLLLEYASDGSLSHKLKAHANTFSTQDIIRYSLQLAEALAALHCRGSSSASASSASSSNLVANSSSATSAASSSGGEILQEEKQETQKKATACYHLDLKPGNILVFGLSLKLCDFGVSRASSHETTMVTFAGRGTPVYMPPEQMTTKSVSARLDIYAFGVILFWILTGKQPHEANEKKFYDWGCMSPAQIVSATREIREAMVEKVLTASRKEAPQFLVDTCVKCLSLNPNERPGNGKVLLLAMLASCVQDDIGKCMEFVLAKCKKHKLIKDEEAKEINSNVVSEVVELTERLVSEVVMDDWMEYEE